MSYLNATSLVSFLREGEAYTIDNYGNIPTKRILGTYNLETGEYKDLSGTLQEPTSITVGGSSTPVQFDAASLTTVLWDGIKAAVFRFAAQPVSGSGKIMLSYISEAFCCCLMLVGVSDEAARQVTADMTDFISAGIPD